MSSRELHELRKALERLRDALTEAVRVLDGAKQTDAGSERGRAYVDHGEPFGDDQRGRRLWDVFGQHTTRN